MKWLHVLCHTCAQSSLLPRGRTKQGERRGRACWKPPPRQFQPLLLSVQTRAGPLWPYICIKGWVTSPASGSVLFSTTSTFFIVHWWHVRNVMANSPRSLGPSFLPSLTPWETQRQFGSCSALKTHSDMDQPALHPNLLVSWTEFQGEERRFWHRRSSL